MNTSDRKFEYGYIDPEGLDLKEFIEELNEAGEQGYYPTIPQEGRFSGIVVLQRELSVPTTSTAGVERVSRLFLEGSLIFTFALILVGLLVLFHFLR